jgi:hypothetical protein
MSGKTLLAVLAGAILMYVWASAAHLSPLGQVGFSQFKDDSVLPAIKAAAGDKAGLYFFPKVDMTSKDAMKQAEASMKVNPGGLMVYHPAGSGSGMSVRQLVGEFALELVETFLAVWLLMRTSIGGFVGRVGFIVGVGVVAAMATNMSYWLWYEFPSSFTIAAMIVEIGKFLFAGIGVALVLGWGRKAEA